MQTQAGDAELERGSQAAPTRVLLARDDCCTGGLLNHDMSMHVAAELQAIAPMCSWRPQDGGRALGPQGLPSTDDRPSTAAASASCSRGSQKKLDNVGMRTCQS